MSVPPLLADAKSAERTNDLVKDGEWGAAFAQGVQSAAHSVECDVAFLYLDHGTGFALEAGFGATLATVVDPALIDKLAQSAGDRDGLLIVNDAEQEPGVMPGSLRAIIADGLPLRFISATTVRVAGSSTRGLLVVADTKPHAGLSAAKTYVLKAHAAQLAVLLELRTLRAPSGAAATGQLNTERLRLLESVVVNANDAVLITQAEPIDLPGPRIVYCNAAFTRTTGYSEAEVLGRTPRVLQSAKTDRATLDRLRSALKVWKPVEVELLNTKKDGTEFWVELSIVPVANAKGWFTHWVSVQRDVSHRKIAEETATRARIAEAENLVLEAEIQERKRVEAQLLYAAFHDDLTKLRNRAFFMDRLTAALARAQRDPSFRCAVLFMDLDRFKLVNDSLGHRAGDLLLMEVANRLRSCVRAEDTLARLGGDEFAILLEDVDKITPVVTLTQSIIETMRRPVWLGEQEIFSSCSVGVATSTESAQSPEELLRDADIAMYEAKRREADGYAIFAGSMHDDAVVALELHTDLRNAVARREFIIQYQPICEAKTLQIVGVEALVRWQHPQRGLVGPGDFIPAAEETNLIRDIGRQVLRDSSLQVRRWLDRFPSLSLRLSVNTSGVELEDRRFTTDVSDSLAASGLDPRTLQLEVTESIFHRQPDLVGRILAGIRQLGVRIALDDFGTGYSSLSYLDRYQIDTVKVDQSFVARMMTRQRTRAIVESIVNLGRSLDVDIVAEGVEEEAQLQGLVAAGCGFVQGYLLGRPMSAEALEAALLAQVASTQLAFAS